MLRECGQRTDKTVSNLSDNQCALNCAGGEKCLSGRAKHIDVKIHFIRDLIKSEIINVDYVPSEMNDADILTKPLGRMRMNTIMNRIGLGQDLEEEC